MQVELKYYLEQFKNKFQETLITQELFGKEEFNELIDDFDFILEGLEGKGDYSIYLEDHKIDMFGMAENAVKLANAGMSKQEISLTLSTLSGTGITVEEVKDWFANYSTLSQVRKAKTYGNIFNVQERMQDIYVELLDHLEEVKNTSKEEFFRGKITREQVVLDIYKEIRTLTKDAKEIIKSINHYQKLKEFQYLVIETIRGVDPSIARVILQKLEQDKALFTALLPPE